MRGEIVSRKNCFSVLWLLVLSNIMSPVFSASVLKLKNDIFLQGEIRSESGGKVIIDIMHLRGPKKTVDKFLSANKLNARAILSLSKVPAKNEVLVNGNPFIAKRIELKPGDIQEKLSNRTLAVKLKISRETLLAGESQKNATHLIYYDFVTLADLASLPPGIKNDLLMSKPLDEIESVHAGNIDENGKFHETEKLYPEGWFKPVALMKFHEWDTRAGLQYSPYMPTGNISSMDVGVLGFGLNFTAVFPLDKYFPMKKHNLRTRWGLYAGYNALQLEQQYSTAKITLIPVMAEISLYYDFQKAVAGFYLSPSFKWHQGVIYSSVEKKLKQDYLSKLKSGVAELTGSYVGYATQWTLGLEFKHRSQPRLAYYIDAGYILHMEQVSGSFLTMNFGVAWHFTYHEESRIKIKSASLESSMDGRNR